MTRTPARLQHLTTQALCRAHTQPRNRTCPTPKDGKLVLTFEGDREQGLPAYVLAEAAYTLVGQELGGCRCEGILVDPEGFANAELAQLQYEVSFHQLLSETFQKMLTERGYMGQTVVTAAVQHETGQLQAALQEREAALNAAQFRLEEVEARYTEVLNEVVALRGQAGLVPHAGASMSPSMSPAIVQARLAANSAAEAAPTETEALILPSSQPDQHVEQSPARPEVPGRGEEGDYEALQRKYEALVKRFEVKPHTPEPPLKGPDLNPTLTRVGSLNPNPNRTPEPFPPKGGDC